MTKPDETTAGAKLVLPGGQKVSLGFQGGTFVAAIALVWQLSGAARDVLEEAEKTREAVNVLGERVDKVDTAIAKLSENAAEIDRLSRELAEERQANSALATKIAAVDACARDKRKC